jgi:hypothetical protein
MPSHSAGGIQKAVDSAMGIEEQGSLAFRIKHADKDWATNNKPYDFPPVEQGTIRALVVKHPTRKIEIRVIGPLGAELVFEGTLPPVPEEGLGIAVTWSAERVQLFLNGKPFKQVQLSGGRLPGGAGAGSSGD